MDAKLLFDGSSLLLLIWNTDQAALGLYELAVTAARANGGQAAVGQQIGQLRFTWTQRTLRLLVTPFVAYVYGPGEVWSTPLKISEDSSPMTVYKPATTARLSSLAYLFVGGVDCKVSGWETRTTCSKPCGGGVRREARQILQQPSQGGQTCPAELAREIACNEQPCPIDCKLSPWKQVGKCSKPCDGGSLEQSRLIEEQPRYDGSPCSDVLDRKIACNVHACDG
ncbi:unnamed protein product, partial [Polarella glacialis]